ncbi:MAG: N-acetyltransferase family protein [Halobacteriota archaeon]
MSTERSVELRPATRDDVPAIRSVHERSIRGLGRAVYDEEQVEAWAAGCGAADYASAIEASSVRFLVAEDDDGIVGFASGTTDPDEAGVDGEVTGLYVVPEVARDGVGSLLLSALEDWLASRGVSRVGLTASRNAVGFYECHGYEAVEEREHEFSFQLETGVTGTVIHMTRELG